MTAETKLPDPPIPADVDVRHFQNMPLGVSQLLNSETWIEAADEPKVGHALMSLWCASWHEVPAGSLPDNDALLRRLAMCDKTDWGRHKDRILSNFVRCSDGRYYHIVVAEKALEAWNNSRKRRGQTSAATAALAAKRATDGHRNDLFNDDRNDNRRTSETTTATESGTMTVTTKKRHRNDPRREGEEGKEGVEDDDPSSRSSTDDADKLFDTDEFEIGPKAIVDAWNAMAGKHALPLVQKLTDNRAKHIRARIKDCDDPQDMLLIIDRVSRSPFLTGKVAGRDGREPFKADLDFILKPDNFAKLIEGKYDDKTQAKPGVRTSRMVDESEQYREHVRRWLRTGIWPEGWGPSPLIPNKDQEKILAEPEFAKQMAEVKKRGGVVRAGAPVVVASNAGPQPGDPPLSDSEMEHWCNAIKDCMARGEWPDGMGPKPWALNSRVPPQVRRKMRAEIAIAQQNAGEPANAMPAG